jgi:hypothetical protein
VSGPVDLTQGKQVLDHGSTPQAEEVHVRAKLATTHAGSHTDKLKLLKQNKYRRTKVGLLMQWTLRRA